MQVLLVRLVNVKATLARCLRQMTICQVPGFIFQRDLYKSLVPSGGHPARMVSALKKNLPYLYELLNSGVQNSIQIYVGLVMVNVVNAVYFY